MIRRISGMPIRRSNNALVHAYYSLYCCTEFMSDWTANPEQSLNAALEFGLRAVTLDDTDSTARWILAVAYIVLQNFMEARLHLERALQLNPNDTEARCVYGWFLTCAGEHDRAIGQFDIAWRQNPFDVSWLPWIRGQAYFNARRYDEAIETFKSAHDSNNEINAWLAASYARAGRATEVTEKLQGFLRVAEREMIHFPGRQPEGWRRYLHRAFPFKDKADFAHLYEGLRKAGLPL